MADRPVLKVEKTHNAVRRMGINPNYWYPVCWRNDLTPGQVRRVTVWNQHIALFQTAASDLRAVENACLHKGVELHLGEVEGEELVCPYHGWRFDGEGACQGIPYLPADRKCPSARLQTFPVKAAYDIIWVFPGEPQRAASTPLPDVPQFNEPDWLLVKIPGHFLAHFSICNENTMDVFHGHLHKDIQGWFDPVLTKLEEDEATIHAQYRISYKGRLAKFLGIADSAHEVTHRHISIDYLYPHYRNLMGDLSALYLMRLPVSPTETRSFSLMFLKLGIPGFLWKPWRKLLARLLWRFMLKKFLDQDKEMMESEQATLELEPDARRREINPAVIALQRVITRQDALGRTPTKPESEAV